MTLWRVFALAAVLACAEQPMSSVTGTTLPQALRAAGPDSGLTLSIYALQNSLKSGDSAFIGTLIRNWGPPREIRNEPEFYSFSVRGPSGALLARTDGPPMEWDLGMRPGVTLPRGGILGQVVNLGCARHPYAPPGSEGPCRWSYARLSPGTYTISAQYRTIAVATTAGLAPPALALESEPVKIVVR